MKLDSAHNDCIWCGRRLVHKSYLVDCQENFGPRPRSDEHIIPRSILGKIVTDDLCKCCNEHFGKSYDHALLDDKSIVEAAKLVGVKETDLWQRFEGFQYAVTGDKIEIAFNKGVGRPKPELRALDRLTVPIVDGKADERSLKNFAARLKGKVRQRKPLLPSETIEAGVARLIAKMRLDPTQSYYDEDIEEGVRPIPLTPEIRYTKETRPWETQWSIAKIFYELSYALWPNVYCYYFGPTLDQWRQYIEKRECSPNGKQGPGIFIHERLAPELAAREHRIEGLVTKDSMNWCITFFGTARWRTHDWRFTPENPPQDSGRTITILNPTEAGKEATLRINNL